MSQKIWWCIVLQAIVSIGCPGDAPPRSPASPPPATSTVVLPDGVLAVVDIDVPKVRAAA